MTNQTQNIQAVIEKRRSEYVLNKELPISKEAVVELVEHAIQHSPSAFNSQSARVIVLFDEAHDKLWNETTSILKGIMGDADFSATQARMDGFKAAAGTVLFFEDQAVVKGLQENFPMYAENFPIWSEQSTGINQYVAWTELASANVGANLQHYNPLIDAFVAKEWNAPAEWKLRGQLVFGGIVAPAGEKAFQDLASRVKVFDK
ncbi:MAG: nitroreductase family protein [Aerococcaceae bacterium]|nr:nitroreductase family protein [Aerococcaceae bacterium]